MKGPSLGTDFSNNYIAELRAQGLPPEEVNRRLYARDRELPDEVVITLHLFCLDLTSGEMLWERELYRGRPLGGRHRKKQLRLRDAGHRRGRTFTFTSPTTACSPSTWKAIRFGETPLASFPTVRDFGTGASPALHGDHLYVLNDNEESGFLAAFDKRSGKESWRTHREITERRKTGWSTPFVWDNELRSEIVTVGPGIVISYDLAGNPLWRMGRTGGISDPESVLLGGPALPRRRSLGRAIPAPGCDRPGRLRRHHAAPGQQPERSCALVRPPSPGAPTSPLP